MSFIIWVEECIYHVIDWWYSGGSAAVIAVVTSAPFITAAGVLLKIWITSRSDKKKRKTAERAALDEAKIAALDNMLDLVTKDWRGL